MSFNRFKIRNKYLHSGSFDKSAFNDIFKTFDPDFLKKWIKKPRVKYKYLSTKKIGGKWFETYYKTFLKKHKLFIEIFNRQMFQIKFSSRILFHWRKEGILNDYKKETRGWRKFSQIDIYWLAIIKNLREFGFDLKRIKKTKSDLEQYKRYKSEIFPLLEFYTAYILFGLISKYKSHCQIIKIIVFKNGKTIIGRQRDIDKSLKSLDNNYISLDFTKIVNQNTLELSKYTDISNENGRLDVTDLYIKGFYDRDLMNDIIRGLLKSQMTD